MMFCRTVPSSSDKAADTREGTRAPFTHTTCRRVQPRPGLYTGRSVCLNPTRRETRPCFGLSPGAVGAPVL